MYNLLRCELLKLRKNREFKYIFLGICVISILTTINRIYSMEVFLKHMDMEEAISGFICFENMISGKSYVLILQNIAVIAFICHDFEKRIIHSEDLAGYSRGKILLSKIIVCFMISIIITFFFVFINTVIISILYGFGINITPNVILKLIRMYMLSVLISCGISMYAIISAYIFKVTSLSIVIWGSIFFSYLFGFTGLVDVFEESDLINWIINNSMIEFFNKLKLDMFIRDIKYIVIVCMLHIIIGSIFSYLLLKKTELK